VHFSIFLVQVILFVREKFCQYSGLCKIFQTKTGSLFNTPNYHIRGTDGKLALRIIGRFSPFYRKSEFKVFRTTDINEYDNFPPRGTKKSKKIEPLIAYIEKEDEKTGFGGFFDLANDIEARFLDFKSFPVFKLKFSGDDRKNGVSENEKVFILATTLVLVRFCRIFFCNFSKLFRFKYMCFFCNLGFRILQKRRKRETSEFMDEKTSITLSNSNIYNIDFHVRVECDSSI